MSLTTVKTEKGINLKIQPRPVFAFYKTWTKNQKASFNLISYLKSHCLGMNYYVNFLEGIGSNGFHIK